MLHYDLVGNVLYLQRAEFFGHNVRARTRNNKGRIA